MFNEKPSRWSILALPICLLLLSCVFAKTALAQPAQGGFDFLELTVVDEQGKPIADAAVDVELSGMTFEMTTDDAGKLGFNSPADGNLGVTVDRPGFVAESVRWSALNPIPANYTFRLTKAEPVEFQVLNVDGEAIGGAQFYRATKSEPLELKDGQLEDDATPLAVSDSDGRLQTLRPSSGDVLLCYAEDGWAEVRADLFLGPMPWKVTLAAWSKIEGKVALGGKPEAGRLVTLEMVYADRLETQPVQWTYRTTTDAQGRYAFDRVVSHYLAVGREIELPRGRVQSHGKMLVPAPGETTTVDLDGGRELTAALVLTGELFAPNELEGYALLQVDNAVEAAFGQFFNLYGKALGASNMLRPMDPQVVLLGGGSNYRVTYVGLVDDGKLRFQDVPPGGYVLDVNLFHRGDAKKKFIANQRKVTVIPAPAGAQSTPVDLGDVELWAAP